MLYSGSVLVWFNFISINVIFFFFFTQFVLCFCKESVKKQLLKRVQNVTPPKKKQGATPSRKRRRGFSFESSSNQGSSADDTESIASTLILERSPQSTGSSPEAEEVDGKSTY